MMEKAGVKPLIKLKNAAFKINDRIVFSGTDWTIIAGQIWAVYGIAGSGVNILLEALLHRLPVTQGKLEYYFEDHGRPYLNPGEAVLISNDAQRDMLLHYSTYYQARWQSFEEENSPSVNEFLSGKSIEHHSSFEVTPLRTAGSIYEKRKRSAVRRLQIKNLMEKRLMQLSNGEARKVLLVRAFMQNPRLLVLDEPFGGLDASSRKNLMKIINEMMPDEHKIIITAHSRLDEIPGSATHIAYVEQNRILKQGLKKEILLSLETKQKEPIVIKEEKFQLFPEFPQDKNPENPFLIKMNNVTVKYGKKVILDHISWTMRRDENWAVLGPNGAGKTTLLSLIMGDNPQAYANDIILFGKKRGSGESIWDIKKKIGWVSPELQLYYYSSMKCIETVCSGLYESIGLYQEITEEQKIEALFWLRLLKIDNLKDTRFSDISAAEQMLILFARALVKKPILLILDELFQNIDPETRNFLFSFIDALCTETLVRIIYVTHHEKELPNCISNILRLDKGRIV